MKRFLWVFFMGMLCAPELLGQVRGNYKVKCYLDLDVRTGAVLQQYKTQPLFANYPEYVNAYEGKMKFSNTGSSGCSAQFGYYLGKKNRFGIQAGVMYFEQHGSLSMDTFHVEFKSSDYKKNVFRQVISSDGIIRESIYNTNVSIPLLLRYHQKVSDIVSLTVDGGLLYNVQMDNNYKSSASFDYEAVYQMEGTGDKLTFHYDNSPKPGPEDWLITRTEFMKDNPKGNMDEYFNQLNEIGFNVGLKKPVDKKSGKLNYRNKTMGYMGQFALNFKFSETVLLKFGAYYMAQSFENNGKKNHIAPTNKIGEYNSLLNFTREIQSTSYGATVGLIFYFRSHSNFDYPRTVVEGYKE